MMSDQSIEVPLQVGSKVTLLTEGSSEGVLFEDYVEQYVPDTGLLRFENSEIGKTEFEQLLDKSDGVEVLTE